MSVSKDINIDNWFGGADHGKSEDFAVNRCHGLRVHVLRRVPFLSETTSGSGIDA